MNTAAAKLSSHLTPGTLALGEPPKTMYPRLTKTGKGNSFRVTFSTPGGIERMHTGTIRECTEYVKVKSGEHNAIWQWAV